MLASLSCAWICCDRPVTEEEIRVAPGRKTWAKCRATPPCCWSVADSWAHRLDPTLNSELLLRAVIKIN